MVIIKIPESYKLEMRKITEQQSDSSLQYFGYRI